VSSGPAKAVTTGPSADNPSLLARLKGIVTRPRPTFAAVVTRPRAAGVLALLTVVSFGAMAVFLATDVGQVALVDQWERTALAFGQTVDDARYAEMLRLSRYGVPYAAASAVVRGPAAAAALAAVFYGVFRARGRRAAYAQTLAVVAHAGVILALRDVVAAPVNFTRESLASPVTFVSLAGLLDEGSPVARFLALLDLFVLWWLAVLAIGLAVLYQARVRVMVLTLFGLYLGIALVLAATMAVLGGSS
jgi:hypothetical protein